MSIKVTNQEFLKFLLDYIEKNNIDINGGQLVQLPCGMFFIDPKTKEAWSADLNAAMTITSEDFSCTRKCC